MNSAPQIKPELYQQIITLLQEWLNQRIWVREFLRFRRFGEEIRYDIYERKVFPVLIQSYARREAWGAFNLAKTAQNLYSNRSLWEKVGFQTEFQFIKQAHEWEPTEETAATLLNALIEWLEYYGHEWPCGILYGNNSANLEECQAIWKDIEQARMLDKTNDHQEFLADFETKLHQHQARLKTAESK